MKVNAICLGQTRIDTSSMKDHRLCSAFYSPEIGLFRIYPLDLIQSNLLDLNSYYLLDIEKHRSDHRKESFVLKANLGKRDPINKNEFFKILQSLSNQSFEVLQNSDQSLGVLHTFYSVVNSPSYTWILFGDYRLGCTAINPPKRTQTEGFIIIGSTYHSNDWIAINAIPYS